MSKWSRGDIFMTAAMVASLLALGAYSILTPRMQRVAAILALVLWALYAADAFLQERRGK